MTKKGKPIPGSEKCTCGGKYHYHNGNGRNPKTDDYLLCDTCGAEQKTDIIPMMKQPVSRQEKLNAMKLMRLPQSDCSCGHTGDGEHSQHYPAEGPIAGHGPCKAEGCNCGKFTWTNFIGGI